MKVKFLILSGVLLVGCSTHPMDPTINMKPPSYVQQMPSKDDDNVNNNPGSLFTNGDNLFSDTKAMNVNDIVTVIITENVKQSSQSSKKLSEADSNNGGEFSLALGNTNVKASLPIFNSTRTFQGSGTQQRNELFQTTISARIIKVLANGNYFIQGSREIYLDGQKQIIEVAGVIRPQDIAADNTIDSKYISDAKIAYKTEGDLKRYTDQNWFSKFWSAIAPW